MLDNVWVVSLAWRACAHCRPGCLVGKLEGGGMKFRGVEKGAIVSEL